MVPMDVSPHMVTITKVWENNKYYVISSSKYDKFRALKPNLWTITLTPFMVLQLFATRFAAYAGGIRVSFIQPCLF